MEKSLHVIYISICFLITFGLSNGEKTKCECGIRRSDGRIIGGEIAKSGQYPWQIHMRVKTKSTAYSCGGSILNDRWILTAAHCVYDNEVISPDTITILAGYRFLGAYNWEGAAYLADKVIMHDEYDDGNILQDIALIRLKTPLEFTTSDLENIVPICMPDPSWQEFDNLEVSGWGFTEPNEGRTKMLYRIAVNQLNQTVCDKIWNGINTKQICIRTIGKSICDGDSGGPLVTERDGKFYEVGIVSFATADCRTIAPQVFTRVTEYLDWIRSNIDDSGSCLV